MKVGVFPVFMRLDDDDAISADSGTSIVESSQRFWFKFAESASRGAFETNAVFKGLSEVMLQIFDRTESGKALTNMRYPESFDNFVTTLSQFSHKAAGIFVHL